MKHEGKLWLGLGERNTTVGQVQDTVKVGSVLIDVETGDSSAPTPTPPKPDPTPAPASSAPSASPGGGGVQQFKLAASLWRTGVRLRLLFFTCLESLISKADIGEGIAEVQLTEWFVKEGDMARNLQSCLLGVILQYFITNSEDQLRSKRWTMCALWKVTRLRFSALL